MDELYSLRTAFWLADYKEAISEGRKLNGLSSERLEIEKLLYVYRAQLCLNQENAVFEETKQKAEPDFQAIKIFSGSLGSHIDQDTAFMELNSLLQSSKSTPSTHNNVTLLTALTYLKFGKSSDALRTLMAVEEKNASLEVLSLKVQLLLQINRVDITRKVVEEMKKKDEDSVLTMQTVAWVALAEPDLTKANLEECEYIYQELLGKLGSRVTVPMIVGLASVYMKQEKFDAGLKAIQKGLKAVGVSVSAEGINWGRIDFSRPGHLDLLANMAVCSRYLQKDRLKERKEKNDQQYLELLHDFVEKFGTPLRASVKSGKLEIFHTCVSIDDLKGFCTVMLEFMNEEELDLSSDKSLCLSFLHEVKLDEIEVITFIQLPIFRLSDSMLTFFTNLRELTLRNCQIFKMPEEIGNCTLLKKLDLGFNALERLPITLKKLCELEEFNLENNLLSEVSFEEHDIQIFSAMKLLPGVNWKNNSFKSCTIHQFSFHPKQLDVSHNKVESFVLSNIFPPLNSIEAKNKVFLLTCLNLSFNHLETFEAELPNLVIVQLQNNRLESFPACLFFCVFLKHVNLENNIIKDKTIDKQFLKLTRVEDFRVEGNNQFLDELVSIKCENEGLQEGCLSRTDQISCIRNSIQKRRYFMKTQFLLGLAKTIKKAMLENESTEVCSCEEAFFHDEKLAFSCEFITRKVMCIPTYVLELEEAKMSSKVSSERFHSALELDQSFVFSSKPFSHYYSRCVCANPRFVCIKTRQGSCRHESVCLWLDSGNYERRVRHNLLQEITNVNAAEWSRKTEEIKQILGDASTRHKLEKTSRVVLTEMKRIFEKIRRREDVSNEFVAKKNIIETEHEIRIMKKKKDLEQDLLKLRRRRLKLLRKAEGEFGWEMNEVLNKVEIINQEIEEFEEYRIVILADLQDSLIKRLDKLMKKCMRKKKHIYGKSFFKYFVKLRSRSKKNKSGIVYDYLIRKFEKDSLHKLKKTQSIRAKMFIQMFEQHLILIKRERFNHWKSFQKKRKKERNSHSALKAAHAYTKISANYINQKRKSIMLENWKSEFDPVYEKPVYYNEETQEKFHTREEVLEQIKYPKKKFH
eukprot:augustus_masked-scaffold_2-processed-gene-3.45-mRNA-1 protein AED:1.00 eAED:1.00 QI:0/0/0/0/1/1/2/0/1086